MTPGGLIDDRFRIERLAGAGGMGVVFRARDLRDERPVAIKVLLRDADAIQLRRFMREAERLGGLVHPSIVRYVAHGSTARGEPYLAMEWLEGETLTDRLARAPLSVEEVVAVSRALASALGEAHRHGLVHRDVKPANVFLDGFDPSRPKLLDFGIARTHRETALTRDGVVLGTAGYMAPEQARGERSLDARVDVFALGCVMFHCLAVEPPYGGDHPLAWLGQLLTEPTPRVSSVRRDIDPALDDVIAQLMASDRDARPADGDAAAALLVTLALATESPPRDRVSDPSISVRERRVVSLLVAEVGSPARPSTVATVADSAADEADDLLAAISRSAARFDGVTARSSDGRVLASWIASGGSVEPAIRAAHVAIDVCATNNRARLGIVTGTTEADGTRPAATLVARATDALASMARAGVTGVRLDAATAALVGGRFVVRADRHEHVLEPSDTAESWARALGAETSPLVGRDRELRLLRSALDDVVEDRSARVLVVSAPAGAGKSRLAREFSQLARSSARVLVAHGDPVGTGASLSIARQWLARAAGIDARADDAATRAQFIEHLAALALDRRSRTAAFLAELAGIAIDDSEQSRGAILAARNDPRIMHEQVRDAFETWLRAMTRDGAVALVCEDVQWTDAASARLLAALQRRVTDAPWLVLALVRGHVGEALPAGWNDLEAEHIALGLLSAAASERIARACLGPRATTSLTKQIADRSGGNPFVVEQLARHVSDLGDNGPNALVTLPDSILALLDARLATLDPQHRRILRAASVFGSEFDEAHVRELLGLADEHAAVIDDAFRSLARSGLLALDGSHWTFRHDLLREAAYGQLLPEERLVAHRRAGEWLVRRGGSDAIRVAEHFERGGRDEEAVRWLTRAARVALDAGDGGTAAAIVARARRHPLDVSSGGELHILAAQAAGLREDWRTALDEARAGCERVAVGSPDWFVGAGGAIFAGAMIDDLGDTPALVSALRSHPASGPATGPRMWGLFLAVTGLQVFGLRDEVQRFVALAEATLAADADPDPAAIGWFHVARARVAVFDTARLDVAHAAALDACEQMDLAGGSFGRAFALGSLGLAQLERGEVARAVATLEQATALGGSLGAATTIISIWHARALEGAGRYDEAIRTLDRVLEVAGRSLLAHNARARRASVLFAAGRLDEALHDASRDELRNEAVAHLTRARIAISRGDGPSAVTACEGALALDARQPHTPTDHALTLTTRTVASRLCGDEAAAQRHALEAEAYRVRVWGDGAP